MPTGVNEAGRLVRQLFDEGALAKDDKILLETTKFNYLGMQVMSNHPGNFILDRAGYDGQVDRTMIEESFLLDKNTVPYEVGEIVTNYEAQVNPFSLNPPASLDEYLQDKQIRLVVLRSPELEALLIQQTEFEKLEQVEDYVLYYTPKNRQSGLNTQ